MKRRDVAAALLGALGVGLAAGCSREAAFADDVTENAQSLSAASGVQWADTIAELRNLVGTTASGSAVLSGHGTQLDGGGGLFAWTTDTTTPDDNGLVIAKSSGRVGAWKRSFSNVVDVRWWGPTAASDLGALISKANTALGTKAGEILVDCGGGTIKTMVRLSDKRVLRLGPGTYTIALTVPLSDGVFQLGNDNSVIGAGWNTIIIEQPGAPGVGNGSFRVFQPTSDVLTPSQFSRGLVIRDLLIKSTLLGGPYDSGRQTISLGNAINVTIENVHLSGTHALGIGVGGDPAAGNHAENVSVTGCVFTNVVGQNLSAVNAKNFHFDGNTFRAAGLPGSPNATYIDLEPNSPSDVLENFSVTNNVIDARGASSAGNGIMVQQGSALLVGPGVVANNSIIGGTVDGTPSNNMSNGIMLANVRDILVTGNTVRRTSQTGVYVSGGARNVVSNNHLENVGAAGGGAGLDAIYLDGTTHAHVLGNIITGTPYSAGSSATTIREAGASDFNFVCNNFLESHNGIAPAVLLVGPSSRSFLNSFDGVQKSSSLSLSGGLAVGFTHRAWSHALGASDGIVTIDATGGPITVSLPSATVANMGRLYTVKQTSGAAGAVTISTTGPQLIDNTSPTYVLPGLFGSVTLASTSTNWVIVGKA